MRPQVKHNLLQKRHWRIRQKVVGTAMRPRLSCTFTGQHIYVQFIDDDKGATLVSCSTRAKLAPKDVKLAANVKGAEIIGKWAGELALSVGIKQAVFDRGGLKYHGKVKALADAARKAGLKS